MAVTRLKKTVLGLSLVMAIVGAMPAAMAASGSAVIKGGHAATLVYGVTELEFKARNCHVPSSQDVDAHVIDLGTDNTLSVTSSGPLGLPATTYSINVTIYDGYCNLLSQYSTPGIKVNWTIYPPSFGGVTTNVTSYPTTKVPGAKWAVVSLAYGALVTINWTTSFTP